MRSFAAAAGALLNQASVSAAVSRTGRKVSPLATARAALTRAKPRIAGGISLGHPVGATGSIVTVKAMYELHRTGGKYGMVTMCIGGGQGIALAIERA